MSDRRADAVAAWATGAGIGLVVLMLTWLVGNRVAGLFWAPPVGPTVAFVTAIVTGIVASVAYGIRLSRRARAGE